MNDRILKSNVLVLWEPSMSINKKKIYRLAVKEDNFESDPKVRFLHNDLIYKFENIDKDCFMYCTSGFSGREKVNNNLHTLVHNSDMLHKKDKSKINFKDLTIFECLKNDCLCDVSKLIAVDKKFAEIQMRTIKQNNESSRSL